MADVPLPFYDTLVHVRVVTAGAVFLFSPHTRSSLHAGEAEELAASCAAAAVGGHLVLRGGRNCGAHQHRE